MIYLTIPRKMGDLHTIAYCGNLLSSSQGRDYFHDLGVLNADFSPFMDSNSSSTPPFYSSLHSDDVSSGYLQDALFEFNSKRRRSLFFSDDDQTHNYQYTYPISSYWNSGCSTDIGYENSEDLISHMNYDDDFAGTGKCMESPVRRMKGDDVETNMSQVKKKWAEKTVLGCQASSSPLSKSSSVNTLEVQQQQQQQYFSDHKETPLPFPLSHPPGDQKKKKRVVTRVVYPFAMVKPGGFEGVTTLNDINRRILMPPTRPVKHPVGDFACRPIVSPDGPGLSGKAVVALTRIQTQGRGTVTIIRTKG